ncbi:MAG: oligosaccharide flippase family protein [Patescibacteria group bacterium]
MSITDNPAESPVQEVPAGPGIYQKSIRGGGWFFASVFGQKALNFASFFILARLLSPSDFGIMTVVTLVVGMAGQLTDFSFGFALTQRKNSVEAFMDAFWTFDVLRSFAIALAIFVTGGWIAAWFNIPEQYHILLRLSGLLILIPSFGNVRLIYLFRNLSFNKIFWRDMASQSAYVATAIIYAIFFHADARALFVGVLIQGIMGVMISYIIVVSRPAFDFRFSRLRELVHFSKWVYGQTLLESVIAQIDKFYVGHVLSPLQLGLYSKAKDLSSNATTMIGSMLNKVAMPAYARIQDQPEKVRMGFLQSVDLIVLVSLPAALLFLLEGGAIISILLGPKWIGMVLLFKIFAFGNLFLAFVRVVSPVTTGLGRPDINFRLNLLQAVVLFPLMYVGMSYYGVVGLACSVVVTWLLLLVYTVLQARKIIHIPKTDFVPALLSAGTAGVCVVVLDLFLRVFRTGSLPVMIAILELGSLTVLYYLVLYLVSQRFRTGPWNTFLSILKQLKIVRA